MMMRRIAPARAFCVPVLLCGLFLCGELFAQCSASFTYTINRATLNVAFNSTSSQSAHYHSWSFGDTSLATSILANPTRTFPRYGTYYVTHRIADGNCSDSVGFYVTIDSIEPYCKASFGAFVDHAKRTVSFNNSSSGGRTGFYFWKMDYGADTNGFNPVRQYPEGVYNVCLTKANGSCIDSVCRKVRVGCSSSFTWKQDSANGLIRFTNFSPQDTGVSYKWSFGDLIGGSSTLLDPSYHYMYNGKYYVCLTTKIDTIGCSSVFCDTVTVDYPWYLCRPYMTITRDPGNPRSVQLSGFIGPEPANSFHWNLGDNHTSSLQEFGYEYADTGRYTVCLTTRRFDGCISTVCDTISVYPDSTGNCSAFFTYKLRSDTTDNDGVRRSVQFYNQSAGAKNQVWLFGDNRPHSREHTPSHHFSEDGTYTVCLVVFDSLLSCSDTSCLTLRIGRDANCRAAFSYRLYSDSTGGGNRIALFADESSGNNLEYEWLFGDSSISAERHPIHYFPENGEYKICMVIRNTEEDCYDSTCRIVRIGEVTTGLSNRWLQPGHVRVFPVPFNETLKIGMESQRSADFEVYIKSMPGMVLQKHKLALVPGAHEIELQTGMLDPGIYFLEIRSGEQYIIKKIIKQHMLK